MEEKYKEDNHFYTNDCCLVAYLISFFSFGMESGKLTERRFLFARSNDLDIHLELYWTGKALVEPAKYSAALEWVKTEFCNEE